MFRFCSLLLVGAATIGCASTTARAQTLIYSDRSPGIMAHALVWQQVAEAKGQPATVVSEPAEFITQLDTRPWSRVIVAARYTAKQPAYMDALRKFAATHERFGIEFLLWHDKGVGAEPDTVVRATMAHYLWQFNTTTISYVDVPSADPKLGTARTVPGCVWPDFAGIPIKIPQVVMRFTPGQMQGNSDKCLVLLEILAVNCATCLNDYRDRLTNCNTDQANEQSECDDLYGPSPGNPGNPEALATCLAGANEGHTGCVNTAVRRYNNCLALCSPSPTPATPVTGR